MENRNFTRSKHGLLGASLPKKVNVGKIHKCELILITKLYVDVKGETNLMFLRHYGKTNKVDDLKTLSDKGRIHDYFSTPVSAPITSLNITYMNSLLNLTCHEEEYQMSTHDPDSYVIK